jgi:putative PIN family toxin of toxin-antitoxin system
VGPSLIASLGRTKRSAKIDRWIKERSFGLIVTPAIVAELRRAARYDRVKRYVPLTPQDVEAWISSIQLTAEQVAPKRSVRAVAADPDDDKYIDAAIEGDADFVVSDDSDPPRRP